MSDYGVEPKPPSRLERLMSSFRREGGESKLDVVEFAPIEVEPTSARKVKMLASVGGRFPNSEKRWELVGGQDYLVSPRLNDMLIINGWAMGTLTRDYSDQEILEERAKNQGIAVGLLGGESGG